MTQEPHFLSSFGESLQAFRKRRRITQEALAKLLGLHRHAVGRWERGEVLPETRGMVLELGHILLLTEAEMRQLLEASLTALSPYWYVPLLRNPYFTGREELLALLHTRLSSEGAVAVTQALSGLGGIGKTQVALEYAYQHALEYSAVFWVAAETGESLIASLLAIAEVLQLPERTNTDQSRVLKAVERWLSAHKGWLLIFDNVEDFDLLRPYLPPARAGSLLLTTRQQATGTLALSMELSPLTTEEALLFLLRRAKVLTPDSQISEMAAFARTYPREYEAAEQLVREMTGLPLALDQAGAYIEETRCSFQMYCTLYQQQASVFLAYQGDSNSFHPSSVSSTFSLAFQRIQQAHPAAADLLRLMAFLQPDNIPEEMILHSAAQLGPPLDSVVANPLELNKVFTTLGRFSLLHRHPPTQTLSIHRLVQVVLRGGLGQTDERLWAQRAVALVTQALPEVGLTTWGGSFHPLFAQALHTVKLIEQWHFETETATQLLDQTGAYLEQRAHHTQSQHLLWQGLLLRKHLLGRNHPQTAQSYFHLAQLANLRGQHWRAGLLYRGALAIQEQTQGPFHPEVAQTLGDLALLLTNQGFHSQAEPLYQRSIALLEKSLGPSTPKLSPSLNGLALLYWNRGRYAEAEPLYQRALTIDTTSFGPDHYVTSSTLSNLALLYFAQGRYGEAEPLLCRSLAIMEQAFGKDHPGVGTAYHNLASLAHKQGHLEKTQQLYQQSLAIREQTLGPDHSLVALTSTNLANVLRDQGCLDQAELIYQRAIALQERTLGPEHYLTANSLANLATLYREQARPDLAEPLYQRALFLFEQGLGSDHPKLAECLENYACLLEKTHQEKKAALQRARALEIHTRRAQACGEQA